MTQTHQFEDDGDGLCKCRLPYDNQRHGGWETFRFTWTQHEAYSAEVTAHDLSDAQRRFQRDYVDEGHGLGPDSVEWSEPVVESLTQTQEADSLRQDAIEALRSLAACAEGDSNDDEIQAGRECADLLMQVLGITSHDLSTED
ncbi:MAG: hypothetical protein ABIQ39_15615 [Ilumatobacteraceae bacterium]